VRAVSLHEYPLSGPGSVPISLIAERARERGVKVLLTGEGADELFGGYHYIYRRQRRRFLPLRTAVHQRASELWQSGWTGLPGRLRNRLEQRQPIDLGRAPGSVSLRSAARERAERAYSHHTGPGADLEATLLTNLTCSLFPFLLNRMDKDAMGHSVETRVPFLDPGVVALALNMPLEARTAPRVKGVLRDVAGRHLPPLVAKRAKHAGLYFDARSTVEAAAAPEFLGDGVLREQLGIPAERWRELVGQRSRRDGFRLWTGEIWARLFLEGQSVERVEQDLWARG
jgi:asparagine synthase (glutamine-hydrolysing)